MGAPVAFSGFGSDDLVAYRLYLQAHVYEAAKYVGVLNFGETAGLEAAAVEGITVGGSFADGVERGVFGLVSSSGEYGGGAGALVDATAAVGGDARGVSGHGFAGGGCPTCGGNSVGGLAVRVGEGVGREGVLQRDACAVAGADALPAHGGSSTVSGSTSVGDGLGAGRGTGYRVSTVRGLGHSGGAARGPNYERNQLARQRKKEAKRARLAGDVELAEMERQVKYELLKRRLDGMGTSAARAGDEARLAALRVQRALREEVSRQARFDAGLDHATEVLRLARDAVAAAELTKYKPVAAVAGWAATVSSGGAESVARTATTNVSLESVRSTESAAGFAAAKGPLNVVERLLIENGVTGEKVIRSARAKVGRPLGLDDVFRGDAPFRMSSDVKREIALAGAGLPKEDQPFYG